MIFVLVLAITALSTLTLLVVLAKLGRPPPEPPADLQDLEATPLAKEAYRDTLRDLEAATSTARRRLRSALAKKIWGDFQRFWRMLRFAIPTSTNSEFGVVAAREFLTFRRLHLMLSIRRMLGL